MNQFDSNSYNSLAKRLEKSAQELRSSKTKKVNHSFIRDLLNAVAILKDMARAAVATSHEDMRFIEEPEQSVNTKVTPGLSKQQKKKLTKQAKGVGIFHVLLAAATAIGLAVGIGLLAQKYLPEHHSGYQARHTTTQPAPALSFQ